MAEVDYYAVLGVPRDATSSEIKKAYRELAEKYHPDKVEHLGPKLKELAHEEMRKLNFAREILLDEDSRKEYDAKLASEEDQLGGSNSATYNCPKCKQAFVAEYADQPLIYQCPICHSEVTVEKPSGSPGKIPAPPPPQQPPVGQQPSPGIRQQYPEPGIRQQSEPPQPSPQQQPPSQSQQSIPHLNKYDIYREALIRALADGVITKDEQSMLNGLSKMLNISYDEHNQLMYEIRKKRKFMKI